MVTDRRDYVIRGRDGFYVARQITAGTVQLVVGRDIHPGGYWCEWAEDFTPQQVRNLARRMIRAARNGQVEVG